MKEQVRMIDGEITEVEVRKAILSMAVGKSPDLDGIPLEVYKKYIDIIAPVLAGVFTQALELGELPK